MNGLKLPDDSWTHKQEIDPLEINDPKVKCNNVDLLDVKENILTRFENISNWNNMKESQHCF